MRWVVADRGGRLRVRYRAAEQPETNEELHGRFTGGSGDDQVVHELALDVGDVDFSRIDEVLAQEDAL